VGVSGKSAGLDGRASGCQRVSVGVSGSRRGSAGNHPSAAPQPQQEERWEKGVYVIDGVKVSYFLNPYWKIIKLLNSEKGKLKRPTTEFVYFSDCFTGKREAGVLKKIGKNIINSLTAKIDSKEISYFGWKLYDKIEILKRKNYDSLKKEYLKFDLFDLSINIFFLIKRSYKPHAKYVLERIKILDILFYKKVKKFLVNKSDPNLIDLTAYLLKLLNFNSKNYFKKTKATN
jgi:ferredoxin-fold anticodon binding domain-containing protein